MEYSDFSPGVIAMIHAIKQNEDIGILTARSNKKNHEIMILYIEQLLSDILNYSIKIDRNLCFFVNDINSFDDWPELQKLEKKAHNSAEKKQIVLEYFSNIYDKVKFYDDETKNLVIANNINKPNIKAYDIKKFNYTKLNKPTKKTNVSTIHFFDLDGTVISADVYIYIIFYDDIVLDIIKSIIPNIKVQDNVIWLTQEQFADYGEKIFKELKDYEDKVKYDFSDFEKLNKIIKQVNISNFIFKY